MDRIDSSAVPHRELYTVPEAMALLSLKRSALYEELRSGRLKSVKRGRTRLVPASAIRTYVDLLIQESEVHRAQAA
jgi:excisionase family DNA binding protein